MSTNLRSKISKSIMVASASCLALAAAPLSAFNPAAEDFVPGEDIIAMVSIHDTQTMWDAFGNSSLVAEIEELFKMPQVREDPDFQEILSALQASSDALGYEPNPGTLLGEKLTGLDLYFVQQEDLFHAF